MFVFVKPFFRLFLEVFVAAWDVLGIECRTRPLGGLMVSRPVWRGRALEGRLDERSLRWACKVETRHFGLKIQIRCPWSVSCCPSCSSLVNVCSEMVGYSEVTLLVNTVYSKRMSTALNFL